MKDTHKVGKGPLSLLLSRDVHFAAINICKGSTQNLKYDTNKFIRTKTFHYGLKIKFSLNKYYCNEHNKFISRRASTICYASLKTNWMIKL